ncbi:MAG: hypothetical protein Q8P02_03755, partial [Candidatus Micrarchaeota archaeon]|nr:hypothetical protein [Candidatus Micrarchaeota archaeon]
MNRFLQGVRRVGQSVRHAWMGVFSPERLRRERMLVEIQKNRETVARSLREKGFHVADVGKNGNLSVVRRTNGDRIVLFKKNLLTENLPDGEVPEVPEHFFPENWQRFGTKFDSTRAVRQVMVKGGSGRSYMVKTISPFRPPKWNADATHK